MKSIYLLIFGFSVCRGFAPPKAQTVRCSHRRLFLSSNSQDDAARSNSRFEGMQRDPTASELAVMDDMITKLSKLNLMNFRMPYLVPSVLFPRRASFYGLPRELMSQQMQWKRKNYLLWQIT
jgi:hypothetical protein